MIRNALVLSTLLILGLACAHPEKRTARYDPTACPVCAAITDGTCSYCYGDGHCMYCQGKKVRLTTNKDQVNDAVKPFTYTEPCTFCDSTGVCTYCESTGKCWACNGTTKADNKWSCLNKRPNQKKQ